MWFHFQGTVSSKSSGPKCVGAGGVCKFFYDSAPSGQYGTMCYIVRGACVVLDKIPEQGFIECIPMWSYKLMIKWKKSINKRMENSKRVGFGFEVIFILLRTFKFLQPVTQILV